jgi:hypothetical protein
VRSGRLATGAALVALAASGAALAVPAGPLRQDPGQLVEIESVYQTVRVVDRTEPTPVLGPGGPLDVQMKAVRARYLRFDEDVASYQSVHPIGVPEQWLASGRYYDHLALGLWFRGMPWSKAGTSSPRALIVGYAGGTLARAFRATAPAGRVPDVVGVELDARVPPLALSTLDPAGPLDAAATVVTGEDGRTYVNALAPSERFDLIVVDAYQRTQYVPFQLATVEFFRACARHLTPGGMVGVNVNAARGLRGNLVRSLASTMDAAMRAEGGGAAWVVPNPYYRESAAIWAGRSTEPPRATAEVPAALSLPAFAVERLLVRHVPAADGGEVLTDDKAPTERLADDTFLEEDE